MVLAAEEIEASMNYGFVNEKAMFFLCLLVDEQVLSRVTGEFSSILGCIIKRQCREDVIATGK
jgi:hypothetical protein